MQAIKCELCGSSDIMKQDGFFQCQNCGTKYNLEEAKKLIGIVKIDKSDDIENLLTLARRYYNEQNYTDSEKYYELVMREKPNDWEPTFFRAYCHAYEIDPKNIDEPFEIISNGIMTSLKQIKQYLSDTQQYDALNTIVNTSISHFEKTNNEADHARFLVILDVISINDHIISILSKMEEYFKQNFQNRTDLLKVIQKLYYSIVKMSETSLKRGERKQLLSRLQTELG